MRCGRLVMGGRIVAVGSLVGIAIFRGDGAAKTMFRWVYVPTKEFFTLGHGVCFGLLRMLYDGTDSTVMEARYESVMSKRKPFRKKHHGSWVNGLELKP